VPVPVPVPVPVVLPVPGLDPAPLFPWLGLLFTGLVLSSLIPISLKAKGILGSN
jgi:uncharacterized membrane protein